MVSFAYFATYWNQGAKRYTSTRDYDKEREYKQLVE